MEGDILYLQQPQHSPKHDSLVSGITKDSIVVFCVDTSGSMGVTTEVCIHVSRYSTRSLWNAIIIGSRKERVERS